MKMSKNYSALLFFVVQKFFPQLSTHREISIFSQGNG